MNIVDASSDHVEYISEALVSEFSKANQFFRYPRYNDKYEVMHKHVQRRIEQGDPEHHYYVAVENNSPVGFINVSINDYKVGTILVVFADDSETKKSLISYVLESGGTRGVEIWESEIFSYDKDLKTIFDDFGTEEQLTHFKIKL